MLRGEAEVYDGPPEHLRDRVVSRDPGADRARDRRGGHGAMADGSLRGRGARAAPARPHRRAGRAHRSRPDAEGATARRSAVGARVLEAPRVVVDRPGVAVARRSRRADQLSLIALSVTHVPLERRPCTPRRWCSGRRRSDRSAAAGTRASQRSTMVSSGLSLATTDRSDQSSQHEAEGADPLSHGRDSRTRARACQGGRRSAAEPWAWPPVEDGACGKAGSGR